MLVGRFGATTGAPYVEGRVVIPEWSVGGKVSFLLDTGADESALMPPDSLKMGIRLDEIGNDGTKTIGGIGGEAEFYQVKSFVIFADEEALYLYSILLDIALDPAKFPSLLGRDILDHWDLRYCKPRNRLTAEVMSCTRTLRTSAGS